MRYIFFLLFNLFRLSAVRTFKGLFCKRVQTCTCLPFLRGKLFITARDVVFSQTFFALLIVPASRARGLAAGCRQSSTVCGRQGWGFFVEVFRILEPAFAAGCRLLAGCSLLPERRQQHTF